MVIRLLVIIFIFGMTSCQAFTTSSSWSTNEPSPFLQKPLGNYAIGFEDFHWIDTEGCPDYFYTGKNKNDFSQENKAYCHEIFVRICYPSLDRTKAVSAYYQPFLTKIDEEFLQSFSIPEKMIKEFNDTHSFSAEDALTVSNKTFPVIFFSPGHGMPAQAYEDIITMMVSYGYIVIAVNTPFNNPIEVMNKHLVRVSQYKSQRLIDKLTEIQKHDIQYVYKRIKKRDFSAKSFAMMNMAKVGVLGHSIGACALLDLVHQYPDMFQAASALDVCFSGNTPERKKLPIPVMHLIAASHNDSKNGQEDVINLTNSLGSHGYLINMSPNESDFTYTQHIDFTDLSTLRYTSAFQCFDKELGKMLLGGFDLKLMSHKPTQEEQRKYNRPTYVLIKMNEIWTLTAYVKHQPSPLDIQIVDNLSESLKALPAKLPEKINANEMEPVLSAIKAFHEKGVASNLKYIGSGNGKVIMISINRYLIQFFDTYLKENTSQPLQNCVPLTKNTSMKCG